MEADEMNTDTTYKRAFIGINWTLASTLINAIANFTGLIFLSRLLSPFDFGLISTALLVINTASLVSELGLGPSLIRNGQLSETQDQSALSFSFLLGIFFLVIFWCTAPLVSEFFELPQLLNVIRALSLLFPFRGITAVTESILLRGGQYRTVAIVKASTYVFGYVIVGIILALQGLRFWSLVVALILQFSLEAILLFYFSKKPIPLRCNIRRLRELLRFGSQYTINRLLANLALHGDNFVVVRVLGPEALGYYTRAYQLFTFPVNLVGQSLDKVLFPILSRQSTSDKRVAELYLTALLFIAQLTGPFVALTLYFASDIVNLILGPGWDPVAGALQFLSISFYFRLGYKITDPFINALGDIKRKAVCQVIYTASIVGFSFLGSNHGLKGIACAVSLSILIYYLLITNEILNLLQINLKEFLQIHGYPIITIIANLTSLKFYIDNCPMENIFFRALGGVFSSLLITSICLIFQRKFLHKKLKWLRLQVQ